MAKVITISIDELKAALPPQFAPVIDNAVGVLASWGKDQLAAWRELAKADAEAAVDQLYDGISDEQVTAQARADLAATQANTVSNADWIERQKKLALQTVGIIAAIAAACM
jgi:hypothetical protein